MGNGIESIPESEFHGTDWTYGIMNREAWKIVLGILNALLGQQMEIGEQIIQLWKQNLLIRGETEKRTLVAAELLKMVCRLDGAESQIAIIDEAMRLMQPSVPQSQLQRLLAQLETQHDTLAAHVESLRASLKDLDLME